MLQEDAFLGETGLWLPDTGRDASHRDKCSSTMGSGWGTTSLQNKHCPGVIWLRLGEKIKCGWAAPCPKVLLARVGPRPCYEMRQGGTASASCGAPKQTILCPNPRQGAAGGCSAADAAATACAAAGSSCSRCLSGCQVVIKHKNEAKGWDTMCAEELPFTI